MERILEKLNEINPGKNILHVSDISFKKFGIIHKGFDISRLLEYLERNKISDDIVYIADDPGMRKELAPQLDIVMKSIYAGMDVQVGQCHGRNNMLNALEFHQGSEVYINSADMILLLGLEEDIKWPEGKYDSSLVRPFYTPGGSVVELKGGCMHYCPVNVFHKEGFNVIVSLPDKTNSPVDFNTGKQDRDKLIIGKNSWFLAHPDFEPARNAGWHLGITGDNLTFKTL